MDGLEIKEWLNTSAAVSCHDTRDIPDHFLSRHPYAMENGRQVFHCRTDRDFHGRLHLVQMQKRRHGAVPIHIYNYVMLTYCLQGSLLLQVEDRWIPNKAGDCIFFDRRCPHAQAATRDSDAAINLILSDMYFQRRFDYSLTRDPHIEPFMMALTDPSRSNHHYMVLHTSGNHKLRHYMEHMWCEELDPQPDSKEMIDLLIGIIMAELARTTNYETSMTDRACKYQPEVEQMLVYIRSHYANGSLQEMSQLFGYEPSTISRLIKNYTGQNL